MTETEASDPRKKSVLRFAQVHDPDPAHSQRVARLALRIFDATSLLHQLDSTARDLLEYACLLHDVGLSASETKHKRRSYEMIVSAHLDGFSDAEREVIASVARYHGSKPPKENHRWNEALSPEDKGKVRYLSAIIRVADALDRTHTAAVEELECWVAEKPAKRTSGVTEPGGAAGAVCRGRVTKTPADPAAESEGGDSRRRIILKLKTARRPDAEISAVGRKKPYFEEMFQGTLELA